MTGEDLAATVDPTDPGAIDVLVVASWFPSYDDPAKGRFVADQVDALAATGVARASVITFDPARLTGGAAARGRQAEVVLAAGLEAARRTSPLFVAGLPGLHDDVAVARLTIPEGLTQAAGRAHGAAHRAALLTAAADRLRGDGPAPRCVVHAHTGYPDGAAAIALADRLDAPLFVTEHASFVSRQLTEPAIRERYAAVLARAERVFAVSEMLAGELRTAFPDQAARIAVLPNAVPVETFPLAATDARRPDELLFVGYRKASKGMETLFRAFAIAHERRPSLRLRLVGSNADAAEERGWHDLVASLGIADVIAFEEARDRAGIAEAMAQASLFVHPSPRETFGVVAVEALATGLPVVAADSGGVTEILGAEPDRLGAIVPPNDPQALADAIIATLDRREDFDAAELRSSVVRRFGSAYVGERLLTEYRQVLAGKAASGRLSVPASATPTTGSGPIVVVALDREQAAARLARLPAEIRSRVTLVTAVEPGAVAIPAVERIVEVAVEPTWRPVADPGSVRRRQGTVGRVARLVTDPRGTINRRLGRDTSAGDGLAPATNAMAALAADGPVEVIPIDGHDHLAIEPLVRNGAVHRSDGGLRRFVDRLEAGRPPD